MTQPELQSSGDMSPPHEPPITANGAAYEGDDARGVSKHNRAILDALKSEGLNSGDQPSVARGILTYDQDGSIIEVFYGGQDD